jgi:ribosome biogenesis GTPase / thiamine phosphate phosphatase
VDRTLRAFGWTSVEDEAFRPFVHDLVAGRIATESHHMHLANTEQGDLWCRLGPRLRAAGLHREERPGVGDFVALIPRPGDVQTTIEHVLPRRTALVRKEAGFRTEGQVLAANIDYVWIVSSLTRELSARRIERFMSVAWDSGAQPVIVLTKADLDDADSEMVAEVQAAAVGAEIVTTSAVTGHGLDALRTLLAGDRTAALVGSSGVGKSTLVNALVGEERLATLPTRDDAVGRHTTTHRELVRVPTGGLLVDTPGLRELLAWDGDDSLGDVYADIEELETRCRFRDCRHRSEPGCAITAALASGDLDPDRLRQREKLRRELAFAERRKQGRAARDGRRKRVDPLPEEEDSRRTPMR